MSVIHEMPGHMIRRLHQISDALFAEECGALSLTSVQYAALTVIGENPDIDATRLSAIIAFDRSTIGDVLMRLEGKGWIERGPSPGDKRVKLLRLSSSGRALLDAVMPGVKRVQERILKPLDPADRARVLDLLSRLVDLHHDGEGTLDAAE